MRATSKLLGNSSLPFWKKIADEGMKKMNVSGATLMRSWEAYMSNMLDNLNLIRCNTSRSTSHNVDVLMTIVSHDKGVHEGLLNENASSMVLMLIA